MTNDELRNQLLAELDDISYMIECAETDGELEELYHNREDRQRRLEQLEEDV